jgi:hypothetical protein
METGGLLRSGRTSDAGLGSSFALRSGEAAAARLIGSGEQVQSDLEIGLRHSALPKSAHSSPGLEGADRCGEGRTGQIEQRRIGTTVGQHRTRLYDRRTTVAATNGDPDEIPGSPAELAGDNRFVRRV